MVYWVKTCRHFVLGETFDKDVVVGHKLCLGCQVVSLFQVVGIQTLVIGTSVKAECNKGTTVTAPFVYSQLCRSAKLTQLSSMFCVVNPVGRGVPNWQQLHVLCGAVCEQSVKLTQPSCMFCVVNCEQRSAKMIQPSCMFCVVNSVSRGVPNWQQLHVLCGELCEQRSAKLTAAACFVWCSLWTEECQSDTAKLRVLCGAVCEQRSAKLTQLSCVFCVVQSVNRGVPNWHS